MLRLLKAAQTQLYVYNQPPKTYPNQDRFYRQIADQLGYTKKQIEELCSRERRKQRKIENGYVLQPKGRPKKQLETQEQIQNNKIVELEMKVELLKNFLSECGRM